ncbi:stalk domain-containing protein [Paenibacillus sp. GCM10012307]|uniref:Copper amine oxidase N-terminal domain-containing protein n=1 Tax=Paenibacillus roseus TaxID=2798579 RepID=A0A934J9E7_9BACL|nr:stalk domain-containing protein [Paenibacillus roseus]MBJ6363993.1 copper amine oxidase N-terminal domain-containing protein [Paenibacillus roseus]
MKRIQKQLAKVTIGSMLLASPFTGVTAWGAGGAEELNTLQFQQNNAAFQFNGQSSSAVQPVTYAQGANYIPLSTIAKLYGFQLSYDATSKESIAIKGDLEVRFAANTKQYKVNGNVQTASGELFTQQGSMMVPIRTWSEITGSRFVVSGNSFVLTWNKEKPEVKTPPVAQFSTDKTEYKMGEPIQYSNESYDDNGTIVKTEWTGRERAFFRPGFVLITLNVTNNHGLTSSVTKEIRITEETMHSEEEFNLLYTPVGEKYTFDGTRVLRMESVSYEIESQPMTLIRSNSPEYFLEEGIAYQDTISGKFRINIHNGNRSGKALTIYLVATNNLDHPVTYNIDAFGKGGPTTYVSTSGKNAVARFLDDLAHGTPRDKVVVNPGESIVVLPEVASTPLKPNLIMTSYTEITTSDELQFTVAAVDADAHPNKDIFEVLPELKKLDRDGRHVRGTFENANRSLLVDETLGYKSQRIVIGDLKQDTFLDGMDSMLGLPENNKGNTGVRYNLQVKVAPNTLIGLNARGGHYAGALLVNDKVVQAVERSILKDPNDVGVLYRTGNTEETVNLTLIIASGSNLPLNFLFLPINGENK